MSINYYFHKWQKVLTRLESVVNADLNYQESKANEKKECGIVQRLSSILGAYIAVYNDCLDCYQQNLQQQKTQYIAEVLRTITKRIIELKHQLQKLEHSNYQFMSRGLADVKLTTFQVEFSDIPAKVIRPPAIQAAIDGVWKEVEELKARIEEEERLKELAEQQQSEPEFKFWLQNDEQETIDEEEDKLDAETKEKRKLIKMIAAQEKCRQVIAMQIHQKLKREKWEKFLEGTAKPDARLEIRTRAAKFIQKLMRAYFKAKRERVDSCKRDQLLGLNQCKKISDELKTKCEKERLRRMNLQKQYEVEWKTFYEQLKQKFYKKHLDEIKEDYRDEIRNWFHLWYKQAWFFYDIPKANQGGSVLILKEEVPSPVEWKEQIQLYTDRQKANTGKSSEQLKQEKNAAKKEAQRTKKEEAMKEKMQERLLAKMMKNPKSHPGYTFPLSKQTGHILAAIKKYKDNWGELDAAGTRDVKEKFVRLIDENNAWAEVKLQIRPQVDDHMREEQKKLKNALKTEYEIYEKEWPKVIPQTFPRIPKPKKIKDTLKRDVVENMVDLVMKGFIKQYPETKFRDFKGEPNFAGDDLRCNFRQASPYAGEIRNVWWEICRELSHGFHKILLVGPKATGKTILVYAMATVNNAVLFEIDVSAQVFNEDTTATSQLQDLINKIAVCARAAQPAVIYIKHIHRIYYTKIPPEEPVLSVELLKKYLVKKLSKKFSRADKVTIVASCQDPWLLKSGQLLPQFPSVIMMPNTTYTTTVMMLKEWVINNRMVPPDLDVSCLAQVLKGYRYGYLKEALENFLSAERIARIAANGLTPQEIFNFILEDESETPVDYEKYTTWYTTKTHAGIQEKKHLEHQLEYEALARKYEEKTKKQKKGASAASSLAGSVASSVA